MRSIKQFMWGYQPHFRHSLEGTAETALENVGASLAPLAMLVGFTSKPSATWPICVEPETGLLQPADLANVTADAQHRYNMSDERHRFHTDQRLNESMHVGFRDRFRAEVLADALGSGPEGDGRRFFVGRSAIVGEYEVHPILSIDSKALEGLPRLIHDTHTNMRMTTSLVTGVIEQVLEIATRSMSFKNAPSSLFEFLGAPATAAVSEAARGLVYSAATMSGNFLAHALYDALRELVTLPYEGRPGAGELLLARQDHPSIETTVRLSSTVPVGAGRQLRKLLELTGPGLSILCDGEDAYGLGYLKDDYESGSEEVFALSVVARGAWELAHAGVALMRVEHGRPMLPKARLSEATFVDILDRVFTDLAPQNAEDLWEIAQVASEAAHGTMLVIHEQAADETVRLAPQAIAITPAKLDSESLRPMTQIDGAVLLSPDAVCHSVGVILDGHASGKGDPGRGARFNSAVRYLQAAESPCVIVIVSEDGMIDVHPQLAPRARREDVEAAIADFESAAASNPMSFEAAFKARRRIEEYAFYLTADQAQRANAAAEHVEEARWEESEMHIAQALFQANPEMNESYFFPKD